MLFAYGINRFSHDVAYFVPGRVDETMQKLMRQHERELAALRDQQEQSRRDQLQRLKVH